MATTLPNPQSETDVKKLVSAIEATYEKRSKSTPSSDRYYLERIRTYLASVLSEIVPEQTITSHQITLAPVPAQHTGDYALQVPHLMRDMKRYRGEVLPALQEKLTASSEIPFSSIELVGPFLNFSIEPSSLVTEALNEIGELGAHYGECSSQSGKRVIVEYSSPNMGKSLHVGHLGTTLVGQGLANVFQAAGALVFRVSHLGDWGTPCGMLEVGYSMFAEDGDIQPLRSRPSKFYSAIYARFNEAQTEDPALRDKAKEAFAALEGGSTDSQNFWKMVREESSQELNAIYTSLNIHFDTFLGEAFYEPYLRETIDALKSKGVASHNEEAIIADLEEQGLKTVLLQKSDGATTYFARDVVALFKRHDLFNYDLSAYVVGSEQTLHFRQLFEIGKQMEYLKSAACAHVPIGLITQKGQKISSRAGGALGAEELRDAIFERAKAQIDETLTELSEEKRTTIASQLTNGALFYNQLLTSPGKSTDFNLDSILDMKGKSGAYLQYACVRGKAILKKVGEPTTAITDLDKTILQTLDPSAIEMIKLALLLPDVVSQCCAQHSPHPLAHYLHSVGQAINQFYQRVRIKDLGDKPKAAYLHILAKVITSLENGLHILNIEVPERM